MEQSTQFISEKDALAIPPPKTKTHVEHWNRVDPAFGIRVMRPKAKTGHITRTWIVGWYEGPHHRRHALGRVGKVTWNAARRAALEHAEKMKRKREQGKSGATPTFEKAYESYVARKSEKWSADTLLNYQKSIGYLLSAWGMRPVDEITEEDCRLLYADIRKLITERTKNTEAPHAGRATATAAMRLAKAVFADLAKRKVIPINPCVGLTDDGAFEKEDAKSRMIPAKDLPVFWRWLHTHPAPAVRDYILMGLFMALRRSVTGSLRWSNLVQSGDHFYYVLRPDQRGNKRRKEIPMPIPTYLVETIIKPRLSSPTKHKIWIIESPKKLDQPLHSVRGTYEALAAKTGLRISDHDLRRTIATLTKLLCGEILAQRILTHSIAARDVRHAVTSGYVITEKDELLEGMDKVIDYVRKLVEAAPSEPARGAGINSGTTVP